MKYSKILAATGTTAILAIIAGLPVNQNGYFLSQEQIDGIENTLTSNETAAAESLQAQADRDALNTTLEASLATAQADLATANAEIERLKAIVPPAPKTVKAEDESENKIDAKRYMTVYDSL
jgi:hypothetical protein